MYSENDFRYYKNGESKTMVEMGGRKIMNDVLSHHGILGQKWGKKNGPPYPLGGGDYSNLELNRVYKARKNKNSIYNKKHFDKVIEEKTKITTLSYDKNRTKNAQMFYAAYEKTDKHQYNTLFNKKIPQTLYDDDGNEIGTGEFYKYRINNIAKTNIKVASEDSGAEAFRQLYKHDRDFYNFVTDKNRMESLFVSDKYKFKGYRESRDALEKIRRGDTPTSDDLQKAYRMFNYVIPNDGAGDARKAKDISTQRAKLFISLKKSGYGALLDTNDAIYGGFKAHAPVIVFDQEKVVLGDVARVGATDKRISSLAFAGRRALGI